MTSPITTLRDEQQLITSLVDLMKQEQQFLVSADSDGLNTITPQKSALVQQAAALAGQRHQALGAAGFPAQEAGMEAFARQQQRRRRPRPVARTCSSAPAKPRN